MGAIYGVAAFNDLTIDQAGIGYTLQATDDQAQAATVLQNPAAPAVTAPFDVIPGPATQLVFAAAGEPPATATAGQDFAASPHQVVVDAEDQFGSIATSYNGPVTIALANNATGTFVGTLTVNAVNGVATFNNLAIDTAGTYELEATSGTPTLTPSTSTSITITPAAPAQLVWTTQPPSKVTELIPFGGNARRRGPVRQPGDGVHPERHAVAGPERQGRQRRPGRDARRSRRRRAWRRSRTSSLIRSAIPTH